MQFLCTSPNTQLQKKQIAQCEDILINFNMLAAVLYNVRMMTFDIHRMQYLWDLKQIHDIKK